MQELEAIQAAFDGRQWYVLAALVVLLFVRVVRNPWLQSVLSGVAPRFVWLSWPMSVRRVFVGAVAFCSSWIAAVQSGQGAMAAALATIPVALAAVMGHKATKKLGRAEHTMRTGRDSNYKPSPFRKAGSLVVPIPAVGKNEQGGNRE